MVCSAESFTFDDIEFWVGNGANRAAIAIDWSDTSSDPPALVWGFRWDGTASGRDMLKAVVAADDRLFAKVGGPVANPVALYGLGYDANDDGQFALDDNSAFDDDGFATSSPADGAVSVDAADHYAEGWFTGFWHYGQAASNPYAGGAWVDAPLGMAGRVLVDGAWDSWIFTPSFNFASFAVNPVAAPSPFPPGDFDRDGAVTAADYNVWRNAFGSTADLAADASGNGVVDAADYTIWRDRFGGGSASIASASVPEPSSIAAAVGAVLLVTVHTVRARRLAF
ncbi:MAG: dockerin type I domain-containing protein [Pirellulales bacterium]